MWSDGKSISQEYRISLSFSIVYPFMSASLEEMAVVDAASSSDFVERLARTLAKVDQCNFEENPKRFRLLARAAMSELRKPTPEMISAAYEAVRFDEGRAINTGRDFDASIGDGLGNGQAVFRVLAHRRDGSMGRQ